jgi:hypothetical protein
MTSSDQKLPLLDIENPLAKLDVLSAKKKSIMDGLIYLGIEYINKVSRKFSSTKNDKYYLLRESIFFRLIAILFHLNLLLSIQNNHREELAKNPLLDDKSRIKLLDSGSQHQIILLDSIIFHAISLFDYFGNLIDYIYGGKGEMRLKWNGVLNSVRDLNNPLYNSFIAETVIRLHEEFVDKLYQHRSDLIHYQTDRGDAQVSIQLMTLESKFVVFAPKRLSKIFPELRQQSKLNRLTINFVAFWICEKTLTSVNDIIVPLHKCIDLNCDTKQGSGIIIRK